MSKWTDTQADLIPLIGDWTSGTGPIYARLAQALKSGIERGDLPGGTRLPPERPLAEALGVSRTTVVLAYWAAPAPEPARESAGQRNLGAAARRRSPAEAP